MTSLAPLMFSVLALGLAGCADEAAPPRATAVMAKPAAPLAVPVQTVTVVPAPEPRGALSESPIRGSDDILQIPSQGNSQPAPAVVIGPEPFVRPTQAAEHRYQIAAERFAKEEMCNPTPQASLQMRGPGVEVYAVACINGDVLLIRCEFGNCRDMQ